MCAIVAPGIQNHCNVLSAALSLVVIRKARCLVSIVTGYGTTVPSSFPPWCCHQFPHGVRIDSVSHSAPNATSTGNKAVEA